MLAGPETEQLWRHWEWPLLPLVSVAVTGTLYLRGWNAARRTRPAELPPWRAWCFVSGLAVFWMAIASPLAAFDDYLLAAHMFQHFLLMSVAPPLLVLGAPGVPLLRGLPRPVVRGVVRPLITQSWLRSLWRVLLHPATVWLVMNATFLGWHVPAAFESTFRSETLHDFEHTMFLFTSCAFWWVVLLPWPARRVWPEWTMIPYLLSSDVLNTILCALLSFSGRIFYPSYAAAARISHLTALQDQVAAGGEMWVLNSSVFLGFAFFTTIVLLNRNGASSRRVGPGYVVVRRGEADPVARRRG